jgi:hypothetical protein
LTFNTTSLTLARALRDKVLIERHAIERFRQGDAQNRLFITPLVETPLVESLLEGKPPHTAFPSIEAEILIGIFLAGYSIRVSRRKRPKKPKAKTKTLPQIEQLEGYDEVWALCPRRPAPGWRVLGRFYRKGEFVALRGYDKHWLVTHYDEAAAAVEADWRAIFGNEGPHRGSTFDDYLSGGLIDVDAPQN